MKSCDSCVNGAVVMLGNRKPDIQKCDTCKVWKTDLEAAKYVWSLLLGVRDLVEEYPGLEPNEDEDFADSISGADLSESLTAILDVAANLIVRR